MALCLNKQGHAAISQEMSTLSAVTKQRIDADGFAVVPGALRQSSIDFPIDRDLKAVLKEANFPNLTLKSSITRELQGENVR